MKVTTYHARRLHHCVSGCRQVFEANGLSFRQFIREGIDVEVMLATNDPLLVEAARYAMANPDPDEKSGQNLPTFGGD